MRIEDSTQIELARQPLIGMRAMMEIRPLLQLDYQCHRLTAREFNGALIGVVRRASLRGAARDGELRDLGGQFEYDGL